MILTDQQRAAVGHPGDVLLVACPGSGKTRTILAKLLSVIDEIRESPRRVACITYTNAAVHEIEHRLKSYGSPGDENLFEVSTIHSFCLNNILRHFYWRIPEYAHGFTVLPPDSEHYKELVNKACTRHNIKLYSHEDFELLVRNIDGTPVLSTATNITPKVVEDFWDLLQAEGAIDFPSIIYYSYKLIAEYPWICNTIASHFSWILVDEFQDTSALQVEILKLLANCRKTKFFLVGDPHQSIFGFAGARPALMDEFANYINATTEFKLLENWRSGPHIVSQAEKLRSRTPPMQSARNSAKYADRPEYFHASNALKGLYNGREKLDHNLG